MAPPRPAFRVRLLAFGPALALAACAQVWPPLGEDYGADRQPEVADNGPETAGQQELGGPLVFAQTLEARYQYIRFLRHADGKLSAFVTVPPGAAESITAETSALRQHCACFSRAEDPATLEVVPDGGSIFSGDVEVPPWGAADAQPATFRRVEDLILIRGTEDDLEEALAFLDLFYNGGPQIEIQAQIVEVTDSNFFERGISSIDGVTPIFSNQSGIGPNGEGPFVRNIGGGFPTATDQNLGGTSGSGGVFQLAALQNDWQFNALIQLLQTSENVDFVSQPSVVTRNGVTANLSSSEQFPYLEPTTVASTGVTGFAVKYRDVGVKLFVLPFLMGGDSIHLNIKAEASRVGRNILIGQDSDGNSVFSPTFTIRTAVADVVVKNREHVVIGGLKLTETRDTKSKVPILGDIPILDWVFSSESQEEVETEVIFLITPLIKSRASISPIGDVFDPFDPDS